MTPAQEGPESIQAQTLRLLWMTDTFGDHNGVSTVLKSILQEIRTRNYPVDLMVCSNTIEPADHLLVVKAVSEFSLPFYRQQPFHVHMTAHWADLVFS